MAEVFDYSDIEKELKAMAERMPEAAVEAAKKAMYKAVVDWRAGISPQMEYPAPIPDQAYRRTETLGKQLTEQVKSGGLEDPWVVGEVGYITPYAPWVVGPDYPGEDFNGVTMYQAKAHQNRWPQFLDVAEANVDGAWLEFNKTFFEEFDKGLQKV
jgi:hypothetical protein